MVKQENKVPNAKLTTVWILWTPPVYLLLKICLGVREGILVALLSWA